MMITVFVRQLVCGAGRLGDPGPGAAVLVPAAGAPRLALGQELRVDLRHALRGQGRPPQEQEQGATPLTSKNS